LHLFFIVALMPSLSGCTRGAEDKTSLSLILPKTTAQKNSSLDSEVLDDPKEFSELNCFLATARSSKIEDNKFSCELSNGETVHFAKYKGFVFANGQELTLNVSAETRHSLRIFASKSSSGTCPSLDSNFSQIPMTNAYLVGTKSNVAIKRGDNLISINVSYNEATSPYVVKCESFPTVIAQPDLKTMVLGQTSRNKNKNLVKGLYYPADILSVGNLIYVVDSMNNRILGFIGKTPDVGVAPDFVLGQKNLSESLEVIPPNSSSLRDPYRIASDGTRLAVADKGNHRVLIWNSLPTTNNQPADVVIGQTDFNSFSTSLSLKDQGGLKFPMDVAFSGGKLLVSEFGYNRISIWNSIPSSMTTPDVVVGQTSKTNVSAGCSATQLNGPQGIHVYNGKLIISDYNNDRVLVYNSIPTGDGTPADLVLGKSNFTSCTSSTSLSQFKSVSDVTTISDSLAVLDSGGRRALIYNSFPTGNGEPANLHLTQTLPTSFNMGTTNNKLRVPISISNINGNLAITDQTNHRIVMYNGLPSSNSENFQKVYGQPDFTSSSPNVPAVSATSFGTVTRLSSNSSYFAVSDELLHRVLIWDKTHLKSGSVPQVVLGQSDFTGSMPRGGSAPPDAKSFFNPGGIQVTEDGKLLLADQINHRVLIWNSIPTTNFQPADLVLGQSSFTSATANSGGISASSLHSPSAVFWDGSRLFVSDKGNHRVLIWNSFPTGNFQAADVVVGQPDFSSNAHPTDSQSLYSPEDVKVYQGKLLVADNLNYRVLVWNSIPSTNHQAADVVIGQPDFTSRSGGLYTHGIGSPMSMYISKDGRLYIASLSFHRLSIFDSIPTANGQDVDRRIGTSQYNKNIPNNGEMTPKSLYYPTGITGWGNRIFFSDFNQRVIGLLDP